MWIAWHMVNVPCAQQSHAMYSVAVKTTCWASHILEYCVLSIINGQQATYSECHVLRKSHAQQAVTPKICLEYTMISKVLLWMWWAEKKRPHIARLECHVLRKPHAQQTSLLSMPYFSMSHTLNVMHWTLCVPPFHVSGMEQVVVKTFRTIYNIV